MDITTFDQIIFYTMSLMQFRLVTTMVAIYEDAFAPFISAITIYSMAD